MLGRGIRLLERTESEIVVADLFTGEVKNGLRVSYPNFSAALSRLEFSKFGSFPFPEGFEADMKSKGYKERRALLEHPETQAMLTGHLRSWAELASRRSNLKQFYVELFEWFYRHMGIHLHEVDNASGKFPAAKSAFQRSITRTASSRAACWVARTRW
jgi:hypothetical protein